MKTASLLKILGAFRILWAVLALGGICLMILEPTAHANDRDTPKQNAALYYWRALAALPDHPRLTHFNAAHGNNSVEVSSWDAKFLFGDSGVKRKAAASVLCLKQGAALDQCDWGSEILAQGTPMFELQRSSTAIGLCILDCRNKLAVDEKREAIDSLLAAWTFEIHATHYRGLIDLRLRSRRLQDLILPVVAYVIPRLDTADLKYLRARISQIPVPATVKEELEIRKREIIQHFEVQSSDLGDESFAKWLSQQVGPNEQTAPEAVIRKLESQFDSMIYIAGLAGPGYAESKEEFEKKLEAESSFERAMRLQG